MVNKYYQKQKERVRKEHVKDIKVLPKKKKKEASVLSAMLAEATWV